MASPQPTIPLAQMPSPPNLPNPPSFPAVPIQEVERRPWKYLGYRVFSQWTASDNDFFVIRRFGALNSRVILKLQDDITILEEELEALDKENSRADGPLVNNGSFRHDSVVRRREILEESSRKLKDYNDFIVSYSALRSRPPAQPHEIRNVENWLLHRYEGAIFDLETKYIRHTDDLMSIVPKIRTPLRDLLEKIRGFRLSRLFRVVPTTVPEIYDPETTHYHSDTRMELFVTVLVVTVGLIMLIAPLWCLMFVRGRVRSLAVITGFIVLFLTLISSVTVAKPFESLAATAAYSAVLMVFMQMGNK